MRILGCQSQEDVFWSEVLGSIDLAWGNDKGGFCHIVQKHLIESDDFSSVREIVGIIQNTFRDGKRSLSKGAMSLSTMSNIVFQWPEAKKGTGYLQLLINRAPERKKKDKSPALPLETKVSWIGRMELLYPPTLAAKVTNNY